MKRVIFVIGILLVNLSVANPDDLEDANEHNVCCKTLIKRDCVQCCNCCCLVMQWMCLILTCEVTGKTMQVMHERNRFQRKM